MSLGTKHAGELLSVIMPVRNGARYLAGALASALMQAQRPIELIVVDGGSTDETETIARSHPEVIWLQQPGRGVADAYNAGLRTARGNWIAFLEHDDLWTHDKLAVQLRFMHEHPELLFTLTHAEIFLEPGAKPPPGYRPETFSQPIASSILSTFLGRAEVFERVGFFNEEFHCAGDVDWFARAKDLKIPSAVLPEVLLKKRMHSSNTSINYAGNNTELLAALRASIVRRRADIRTASHS